MPVAAINLGNKIWPWFPYPRSGAVVVYVEASSYVDIFISSPQDAPLITNAQAVDGNPRILSFPKRMFMNERFTLPSTWQQTGWTLTIGHSGAPGAPPVVAVYYTVYEA
jgi:hypothetical protein